MCGLKYINSTLYFAPLKLAKNPLSPHNSLPKQHISKIKHEIDTEQKVQKNPLYNLQKLTINETI